MLWTKIIPELWYEPFVFDVICTHSRILTDIGCYSTRYGADKKTITTIVMGLLVGNNVGSYLTIVGALAGLMWMAIVNTHSYTKSLQTSDQEEKQAEVELAGLNESQDSLDASSARPGAAKKRKPITPVTPFDLTRYGSFVLAAVVFGTGLTIGIQVGLI